MKVWAHSNNTRINFDSCKQAAKWSKKNNNTKWFYDNGNGPKPGLKSENKRANYLSRITGLVVSSGYDNIKRKDFFYFENNCHVIFQSYSYTKAKAFALGFIAGKNNAQTKRKSR